ncbi:MAG: MBL fold metallo-hydrolase [Nanoarchaeota archaeon]|nr:MBL fold metallo-hydrolase [Nanoarchaeota archaeon]
MNNIHYLIIISTLLVTTTITISTFGCSVFHNIRTASAVENKFPAGENSIIFVGHSTTLIHLSDVNILTDPNFNSWSSILYRSREAGMQIKNLPPIDAILVSHPHYDHLDKWTLEQFSKDIPIVISKGNGELLSEWGLTNIYELNPWDTLKIKGVKITAVPAQHSGSRNSPWADSPKALGYIVQGEKTIYFVGDTGLFDGFKEIGNRFQIDVALLPIGAYRPRWFMKDHHLSPNDAINAMEMLEAKNMIPIHWGSFKMAFDGVDEPKEELLKLIEKNNLNGKVHLLENGEKFSF